MKIVTPQRLLLVTIGLASAGLFTTMLYLQPPPKPHCRSSRGCDRDFSSIAKVTRRSLSTEVINGWNSLRGVIENTNGSTHYLQEILRKQLQDLEEEFRSDIGVLKHLKRPNITQKPSHIHVARDEDDADLPSNLINRYAENLTDGFVRNCITQNVVGEIPDDLVAREYKAVGESTESHMERMNGFQQVFDSRAWGHGWDSQYKGLNASGMGATLTWTQEAIATLHTTISLIKKRLGISRVKMLDIPCGDMAWMSRFLKTRDDIDYTGWDIVPDLIAHHKLTFKTYSWNFILGDIVTDHLNESYHLILSRTLMQHLFFKDAMQVLEKFSNSGSHFVLMTTWSRHSANEELRLTSWNPGRMRRLNLEISPINLIPPICLVRDGPPDAFEGWDHFLGLWSLPLNQVKGCRDVHTFKLKNTDLELYSCTDWSIK